MRIEGDPGTPEIPGTGPNLQETRFSVCIDGVRVQNDLNIHVNLHWGLGHVQNMYIFQIVYNDIIHL